MHLIVFERIIVACVVFIKSVIVISILCELNYIFTFLIYNT